MRWLQDKMKIAAGYLAVSGIFFLTCWLYRLPVGGCVYAFCLTLAGFLIWLARIF